MSDTCNKCGDTKNSWTRYNGELICTDCAFKLKREELLNKASQSDSARFFKDWSSKDRTTAFFEAFGRYVKEPNKRDIVTIMNIQRWASHADHALSVSIGYTFKWANMDLHTEYKKWISNIE